jgi:hypothetical protein
LHQERGLNFAQIARELNLDEETVAKWARAKNYTKGGGKTLVRKSKLEPYKIIIQRWLERHSYTATQIFQRLRAEEGYTGGFTILKDYVRTVRRMRAPAFLTLSHWSSSVAQSPNIHSHEAYVIGELSALGELSNFAKKFSEQFRRRQPDALAYCSNQAIATVHFVVGCFHLEEPIGKEHDKIVFHHWTLGGSILGFCKQAKCRSAAAVGSH